MTEHGMNLLEQLAYDRAILTEAIRWALLSDLSAPEARLTLQEALDKTQGRKK